MIWICISRMCPEQYDIYKNKESVYLQYPIAYFRLRHGNLSVYPYKHGEIDWNTTLYKKYYTNESGFFDHDDYKEEKQFQSIKRKVNLRIRWYLFKQWIKNLFK